MRIRCQLKRTKRQARLSTSVCYSKVAMARRQLLSFVLGRDAFKAGRGMGKLDDQKEGFRGALIGGSCRGKVAAGG